MTRNYFKAGSRLFFFAAHDESDTIAAYLRARALGPDVSVFAAPTWRGPWDVCPLVGQRSRSSILVDIAYASDNGDIERLELELGSLPSTHVLQAQA